MKKHFLTGLATIFLFTVSFTFGQNSMPAASATSEKARLATELFGETSGLFPANLIEEIFTQVADEEIRKLKTEIPTTLGAKVDENRSYSARKKAAIKAKLPELADNLAEAMRRIFTEGFTVYDWVGTASIKNFEKKLSTSELQELIDVFQSPRGREFIALFNETVTNSLRNDKKNVQLKGNSQLIWEFERFAETPLGKKFFNVLINDIYPDVTGEAEKWGKNALNKVERELKEGGSLYELMMEFARQNF